MTHPLITLALAFGMMSACWLLSLVLNDVSIVDILWAPAFAALAFLCVALAPSIDARGWIVLALVSVWALRLGSHILARWRRLGHEDYRYAEIRRKHEPGFRLTSLFWIFWLQALLLWVISWPLQAVFSGTGRALNWADGIGIVLATGGIAIEAVADRQLTHFRADPQNQHHVLKTGIWAWSRHPNYFGDFALWWGFFVIALAGGAPLWVCAGPIVMSALLIRYSGAGLMEDTITNRRAGYADYVRSTSKFIPWPPKR